MLALVVDVHVLPECVDAFRTATLENARNSVQEAGILRFDVMQQQDDPTRFMLYEVYRSPDAHALHRETPHYHTWRDAVESMMAEPRKARKFTTCFPADADWR
jgi:(4S)-4-hydroxy-5-phosphonooxypentane-2,3-dione isomerase